MSSSPNKIYPTYVVLSVFVVSLIVFVISVVPTAYFVSGNSLAGAAGQPPNPEEPSEPSTGNTSSMPVLDRGVSIISGLITIISGVLGLQTTRSGFAALKAKEIDKEMQMREIEILRLELELEKQKKDRVARKTRAKKK